MSRAQELLEKLNLHEKTFSISEGWTSNKDKKNPGIMRKGYGEDGDFNVIVTPIKAQDGPKYLITYCPDSEACRTIGREDTLKDVSRILKSYDKDVSYIDASSFRDARVKDIVNKEK